MSTFSQDLDFFDATVFDPLAQITENFPKVSLSSSVFEKNAEEKTKIKEVETVGGDEEEIEEEVEDEKEEEEEEEDDDDGFDGGHGYGDAKDFEKDKTMEEKTEEKNDASDHRFSTELWSDRESTTTESMDSWDFPLGTVPWDDQEKPIVQLLNYADLTLTPEEENGLLTDRIVAACSSYLTESPENKCHVVAKAKLSNKNLNDIRILGYHRFLQYVDLSWNNLRDLTPLGCIPYLMYLDVSHNLLEDVLRFRPPLNLTYVNYSYNEVWQLYDLSNFWTLCYLDLSHNKISKIQGLHNLRYLRYLDLSYNKIERFENLSHLRITDLNVEYNLISKFETERGLGLVTMPYLSYLHLNNNLITSLTFLKNVYRLKKLELQNNNIADLVELTEMKHLKNLRHLDMSENPVNNHKPYRNLLIGLLPELKFLDDTEVNISERVATGKNQTLEVQLEAARKSIQMILMEQFNDSTVGLDVVPIDQGSYPFVILVGPSASSKKQIISCLAEKFPEKSKKEHVKRLKMTYGPVVSALGAAYMSQRQFVNTHESNIKRVQCILDDVIEEAIKMVPEGSNDECEECPKKENEPSSSFCLSERKNSETMSDAGNSSDFAIYFDSSRKCYPCTPSQCGFQTCKNAAPESSCETNQDYLRTDTLSDDNQVRPEPSVTSYSSENNSPLKLKFSFIDEYSYGEQDPFSDWSIPFIEWEEVSLSDCQVEEAAEMLCTKYVENVMSTKDVYQNLHLDNPGLFSLCVHTDVINKAVKTLEEFLKEVWESTPHRKPTFDMHDDLVYQAFVPKKLECLKKILRNDFLSSGDNKDSVEVNRSSGDHRGSPPLICREMRLKGYGDSFDGMP